MKNILSTLLITISLFTFGQEEIEMKIKVLSVDSGKLLYNFYTFDSICFPTENLIRIKQLWVNKNDSLFINRLKLKKSCKVIIKENSPDKYYNVLDTSIIYGPPRGAVVQFFNPEKILIGKDEQEVSDFIPDSACIIIRHYELKEIK